MTDINHSQASDSVRIIDDTDALRALSHPVRLALLEALLGGPLTATQAGEAIGETATTCSFHLRQLAKYGFVEEAGRGKGRSRPWRRTHSSWAIPPQRDDAAFTESAQQLHAVMLDRYFQRLREVIANAPGLPKEWYDALVGTEAMVYLTAEETRQVATEFNDWLQSLATRWGQRSADASTRPDGARAVEVLFFAVPVDQSKPHS